MSDTVDLQKDTPGGGLHYEWVNAGDIVAVAKEHVLDLITASHGDIHRVVDAVEDEVEKVEAAVKPKGRSRKASSPVVNVTDLGEAITASSVMKSN